MPVGILFKSAHTRGGFTEDIKIHDMKLIDTAVVLRITMNWNPSYSYAAIPPGLTGYPDYYKVLTAHVPAEQGIAHVRDVHLWNIKATGAKTAFEVDAYANAPLTNFQLDKLDIQAQSAGHIADAKDWVFKDLSLVTLDGSAVKLTDSTGVTGLRQEAK